MKFGRVLVVVGLLIMGLTIVLNNVSLLFLFVSGLVIYSFGIVVLLLEETSKVVPE